MCPGGTYKNDDEDFSVIIIFKVYLLSNKNGSVCFYITYASFFKTFRHTGLTRAFHYLSAPPAVSPKRVCQSSVRGLQHFGLLGAFFKGTDNEKLACENLPIGGRGCG